MSPGVTQRSLIGYLAMTLVAAIPAAAAMIMAWDVAFLDNDAAQYLSVARNLLDGDGISSSVLFYEEQLASGRVPAPQTVFPPGMSIVLAALLAAGVQAPVAILAAGVAGYAAVGVALALVLRTLAIGPYLAFLGAAIWLAQGTAWAGVMLGRSEIAFTLATLLSAAALPAAEGRRSRYALAGALAAAGVLIRYQGLFFVAALGLWSAWTWLRTPGKDRRRFSADAAILLLLPLAAAGYLLVRNLLLTGAPGGGPVDTAVWNAAHGFGIVRSAYWALVPFLGLSLDGLAQLRWQEVAVAIGGLLLAGWLLSHARIPAPMPGRERGRVGREALGRLAVCYVVVTAAALGILATRSTGYMQGRFLLPLVPFIAVAWMVALDHMGHRTSGRVKAMLIAALVSMHAGLFAAQGGVIRAWLDELRADRQVAAMRTALAADISGVPLAQFLRDNVSSDAPLLATGGQRLWLLLELPVVETTPAGFSDRTWDEEQLRRLSRCLGVRFLLYIPGVFDANRPENRNQLLYQRMARGEEPAGMTPRLRTPAVRLYEFDPVASQSARGAEDRGNDDCN
jgi:hypothetical protein